MFVGNLLKIVEQVSISKVHAQWSGDNFCIWSPHTQNLSPLPVTATLKKLNVSSAV